MGHPPTRCGSRGAHSLRHQIHRIPQSISTRHPYNIRLNGAGRLRSFPGPSHSVEGS
jgi:hypothetical protein